MSPVEFDGIRIAVLDRPIGERNCRVIHAGRGEHDGETFSIVSEDGDRVILSERLLQSIEMALSGHWKKKYPNSDWYIVAPILPKAEQSADANCE